MPTVGHLLRLRRRLACGRTITRTTVAADDFDLRVLPQPGDDRVALTIGKQVDHLTAFEIDHDAPVAVAAAPGEVVDADHPRRWRRHGGRVAASQNPKHRVARPRRRQTRHHARTRPATQRDRHRTHQRVATTHPAAISPADRRRQRLAERAPWARRGVHRNRRTDSRSLTMLPLTGRSDSVRWYRLWRDIDGIAQSGQFAPTAANRPDISTTPWITVRLSTINPGSRRLLSHAFEAIDVRSLLTPPVELAGHNLEMSNLHGI